MVGEKLVAWWLEVSQIVKFCLGHSHLSMAYFERIIRLFFEEHVAEVCCFEGRGRMDLSWYSVDSDFMKLTY